MNPASGGPVAPMFPLPRYHLFPGRIEGLHVFEERYRRLVEDLLDRRGWLVLVSIEEGHESEASGAPPVYPVGTLAEIVHHQRLEDGRFLLSIAGLSRVRLHEIPSALPYRQVVFEPLPDVPPPPAVADRLSERLRDALKEHGQAFGELPADLPTGALADLLISTLALPVAQTQRLFEIPSVAARAQAALDARG